MFKSAQLCGNHSKNWLSHFHTFFHNLRQIFCELCSRALAVFHVLSVKTGLLMHKNTLLLSVSSMVSDSLVQLNMNFWFSTVKIFVLSSNDLPENKESARKLLLLNYKLLKNLFSASFDVWSLLDNYLNIVL